MKKLSSSVRLLFTAMLLTLIANLPLKVQAQITNGLKAYYSFDHLGDGTGLNPDAVLNGGATIAAGTSKLPYSFSSGGANLTNPGYLTIPQPNQLNFGDGSFTVAGWVRLNEHNNGVTVMGNTLSGNPGTGWRIEPLTNGNWTFFYDSDTQPEQQIGFGGGIIPHYANYSFFALWTFVAVTVNTTTGKVQGFAGLASRYWDGPLINPAPVLTAFSQFSFTPGGSVSNSNPFYLGNGFSSHWDEFRAWNRVLSQSEIEELYNSGNVMDPCSTPAISFQDLDGDGYGTTASTSTLCPKPAGYSYLKGDCNDNNAAVNRPGAAILSGSTSICSGEANLTISATGSSPFSGTLSDGTAFSGNSSPIQVPVSPFSTTAYNIASFTAGANAAGCEAVFSGSATVTVTGEPPVTTGESRNGPGVVNLSATASGTMHWYDAQTGGNLVNTGASYSPDLPATQTFYVDNEVSSLQTYHVGLPDNSGGGNISYGYYATHFNISSSCLFKSFTFYPLQSGEFNFVIYDNGWNTQFASIYIYIDESQVGQPVVVPVNTSFEPGDYLVADIGSYYGNTGLFMGSSMDFPFTASNSPISLTGTDQYNYGYCNYSGNCYGFMYDLQAESGGICISNRAPVTGTIISCPAPVIGTVTQPDCVTQTGSIELTGLPETGTWTINGSITGSGTTTVISDLAPNTIYSFSVTTESGCTSDPSAEVGINEVPVCPCNKVVVGTVTQPDCVSGRGKVELTGLPETGNWSIYSPAFGIFNGSGVSAILDLDPGNFTFSVSVDGGCSSSDPTDEITLDPAPPCQDCVVSDWSEWSAWSTEDCGVPASRTRTRIVITPAEYGGATCPDLEETEYRDNPPCPIDCVVSAWSEWSDWSPAKCGYEASRTRTRYIISPAENGGAECTELIQTENRINPPCPPVDCVVGDWEPWTEWSTEACGERAFRTRMRYVIQQAENGGAECGELMQTEYRDNAPCPVDCVVSGWSEWSEWSTGDCGVQASRTRTRTVITPADYGGATCPDLTETEYRDNPPCPVDCVVSAWSDWSTCTKVCGSGMQTRTRTVITPAAYGGAPCPILSETRACNEQPCPVDCVVSAWSDWSTCTKVCGSGTQTRTRTIITPAAYGGTPCPNLVETQPCNTQPCPVNCKVSDWSVWSECTKTCGGGVQTRTRTIVTYPAYGGIPCPIELTQTRSCNEQPCPVDCVVSDWSDWSECTKICGGGTQTRTRTVITPAMYGGVPCPMLSETRSCNEQPCPVDCVVSPWSDWSPWSSDCGYGFRTRTRTVVTPAAYGGRPCPQMQETETRTADPCLTVTITGPSTITCYNNPTVSITAVGNYGQSPYQYMWSTGSTSQTLTGLGVGNYSVTITDANGKTAQADHTITTPVPVSLTFITNAGFDCPPSAKGSIEAIATGGRAPYQYNINNGPYQVSNIFPDLDPGKYNIRVRDANGCIKTMPATLSLKPYPLTVSAVVTNILGCADGSIIAEGANGEAPYEYKLENGSFQGSGSFTNLDAGTYQITVKSNNGCTASASFTVANSTGDLYEPNNTRTVAKSILIGQTVQAKIGIATDVDWYKFLVTTAGIYSVSLSHPVMLPGWGLYTNSGSEVTPSYIMPGKMIYNLGANRNYFVRIKDNSNLTCYNLLIEPSLLPVDCVVSDWSPWSDCDKSCGGGTQTRTRTVITPASNGGASCPELVQTQACNTQPCPVDCVVSDWSPWSDCDKSCGGGMQTRTRTVITPAMYGGAPCPELVQTQPCNTQPCPVDCVVSDWSPWSNCDKSCGGGMQTRTRTIITPAAYGGRACPNLVETQPCNTQPCPVDCVVSAWSPWSNCDKSCGGGMQTRTRTVITPAMYGGIPCPNLVETQPCNTQPCPVDCVVSDWSPWSACTTSCGGGIQTRTRTVITPAAYGGAPCPVLVETQPCNTQPCPVDCVVSAWSEWSACTAACDGGVMTRTRTVITPAMYGGAPCPELVQEQPCNTYPCPTAVELLSSKQLPAANENTLKAVAYPNPHAGTFVLRIESPVAGKGSIVLYDLMGRAIVERTEQLKVGSNQVRFSNVRKMNFIYRVLIDGKKVSGKIFGLE